MAGKSCNERLVHKTDGRKKLNCLEATNDEAKKKQILAKAEKAIRIIREIIEQGGEAAEYILENIAQIMQKK